MYVVHHGMLIERMMNHQQKEKQVDRTLIKLNLISQIRGCLHILQEPKFCAEIEVNTRRNF